MGNPSLRLSEVLNLSSVPIQIVDVLFNLISYHIVMMIILLNSAAILLETILLVNCLRLRLVEV